jgi:small subunit ribosomal protein S16
MLKIRLQRVGRKHEPTFRVVLTDSKNGTKSGRFHEVLGSYDPRKKTEAFEGEKIKEWMKKGAQLSDTLKNLLITHKIIDGKKVNVLPRKAPYKTEAKLAEEKALADKIEAEAAAKRAEAEALQAEAEAKKLAEEEASKTPEVAEAVVGEKVPEVATEETPSATPEIPEEKKEVTPE